jgi:endo-1,4-beta-D-glucanase Y
VTAERGRRWALVVGATALVAAAIAPILPRVLGPRPPSAEDLARAAADRFLDRYMEQDGRVVRHDQGGDTVSEGQAYAMLVSVAIGDQLRFDRAWGWAKTHLQRSDALLAWRWHEGRVPDPNSASDADLDAAQALVLAARQFGQSSYLDEGRRIARSILAKETVLLPGGSLVLVAGPWARTSPYAINPSYFAPSSYALLGETTGDPRWGMLLRSSHQLVGRLTGDPPSLPPDWAQLDGDGNLHPIASPGADEGQPRYSFDAPRLLVRLATDCSETSHRLAVAAGRLMPLEPGRVAAAYDLKGVALVDHGHPLADVAASAVALRTGDQRLARQLLEHAEALDRQAPTYYGAAWLALGRIMLTTNLLTECSTVQATAPQPGTGQRSGIGDDHARQLATSGDHRHAADDAHLGGR